MIESFDGIKYMLNPSVEGMNLSLKDGDILVVKFDSEKFDLEEAISFSKAIEKVIPDKVSILTIFNGIEIGVINYEN